LASTAVDFSKTGIPVNMADIPQHDRYRPDFMAPSPRVVVSQSGHLDIEEDDDSEEDAFADLDSERRTIRYYESNKVLGQLYRNIDEQHFLSRIHFDRRAVTAASEVDVMDILLRYIKREASKYVILYSHHKMLAEDIRSGYVPSPAETYSMMLTEL
jgi:hypothetical protein